MLCLIRKKSIELACDKVMGWDCIVGIAIRYWLDGTRMESWKRLSFPHPPNRPFAPPTSYTMAT